MKIALRGGHCRRVIGAVGILNEYEEMKKLYTYVEQVLRDAGHTVINCSSDAGSANDDLKYGVNLANSNNCDIFISLHMNAFNGSAHGTECWTISSGTSANTTARRIVNNYASLGFYDRGVKHKGFYELKYTNMPAIIVESLFCDSQKDVNIYNSLTWDKLARSIANGIDTSIPLDKPVAPNQLYRVRKSWSDVGSQKGAYSDLDNAISCCKQYYGYSVFDSYGNVKFTNGATIEAGSTVKIVGNNYATGQTIPTWVKNSTHTVDRVQDSKALISGINSWVYLKDLVLA